MPLKSQAQAGFLKANKPALFKEFKNATPKGAKLPPRIKKGSLSKTKR